MRGIVSVNVGLVGKTIARFGTEEQKREWLPKLASGEALGCYALTEPGCGSDAAALVTRAERDGDGWVLTGSKTFITLGTWAAVALVFARTGGEGPRGITCFLVPTDADGFASRPIKGKLGLRAQDTAELSLDGVRVPDANRLGELDGGFRVAMSALDVGRISLAAGCVGIAQGCLDASIAYARERARSAGRSRASSSCRSCSPRWPSRRRRRGCSAWRAAALADARAATRSSRRWRSSTRARSPCAPRTRAVQVFGGYGYVDEYPVRKYLRDARVTTLYEGTSQIQKLIIGRALTGESGVRLGRLSVFRYATSACSWSFGMIPPQCGMLTIGARPSTLPVRMKSFDLLVGVELLLEVGARKRGDRLVGRLRVRHAAETVRAVAVDAAVAHVERRARDRGPWPVRGRRRIRRRHGGQARRGIGDKVGDLLRRDHLPPHRHERASSGSPTHRGRGR